MPLLRTVHRWSPTWAKTSLVTCVWAASGRFWRTNSNIAPGLRLATSCLAISSAEARRARSIACWRRATESAPSTRSTKPNSESWSRSADAGGGQPLTKHRPYPIRYWYGPHVPPFADQVHDRPAFLALLDVGKLELDRFMASQPTCQQHRKQCAVTLPLDAVGIRSLP